MVNIAGYRFVDLPDRDDLQAPMLEKCNHLDLKGSILLSPNGINFFLSGKEEQVKSFIDFLESDTRFAGIPLKTSFSEYQPFRRMLVKRKREIISLGMDEIRPADFSGQRISPGEFRKIIESDEDILVWIRGMTMKSELDLSKERLIWEFPPSEIFPEHCNPYLKSIKKKQ